MAGLTVEQIQIIVDAEVAGAIKNLKKVDTKTGDLTKSVLSMAKKVAGPAGFILATKAAISFGLKGAAAASSAEEAFSKFQVVFGDSSDAMVKWAEQSAEAVGLSEQRFISMASTTGDLLKPLGFVKSDVDLLSKSFVELAMDVSSFNDVDPSTVLDDINGAITGSPERMKKYGVVINETALKAEALATGISDGTVALNAQEKAQATYQLVLKGTVDAQGDLKRTMDSSANVSRRLDDSVSDLSISIGKYVNDGLTPLKAATATMASGLADWIDKQYEAKQILKELGETGKTEATSIEDMRVAYDKLGVSLELANVEYQQKKDLASDQSYIDDILQEEISTLEDKQDVILKQIAYQKTLIRLEAMAESMNESNKELMRQQARDAALALEQAKDELTIRGLLAQQAWDDLTPAQQSIKLLQDEIDLWSEKRDLAGVQEYLNGLIEDRNALEEEQKQILEDNKQAQYDFVMSQVSGMKTFLSGYIEADDKIENDTKDTIDEMETDWNGYAGSILSTMSGVFSSLSSMAGAYGTAQQTAIENEYAERLESLGEYSDEQKAYNKDVYDQNLIDLRSSGDTQDALQADAIEAETARLAELATVTAEMEKKKQEAAYETSMLQWKLSLAAATASGFQSILTTAASAPWPLNIPLTAGAAAVAGINIAGVNAAKPVKAFARGTDGYMTNGPESILVGDNPGGQEKVTVEPISSGSNNSSGGSGQGGDLYIDGKKMGKWISNSTKYGDIKVYGSSGKVVA